LKKAIFAFVYEKVLITVEIPPKLSASKRFVYFHYSISFHIFFFYFSLIFNKVSNKRNIEQIFIKFHRTWLNCGKNNTLFAGKKNCKVKYKILSIYCCFVIIDFQYFLLRNRLKLNFLFICVYISMFIQRQGNFLFIFLNFKPHNE
jgi:hypothetical protein